MALSSETGYKEQSVSLDGFAAYSIWALWKCRLKEKKWHITTGGKNAIGVSEKKPKKQFYASAALTRVSMTGRPGNVRVCARDINIC